jgi:hypothetical protein
MKAGFLAGFATYALCVLIKWLSESVAEAQKGQNEEVGTVPEGVAADEPTPRCNICGKRVRLNSFAAHMDAHKAGQNQQDPAIQSMIDSSISILTKLGYKVIMSEHDKWEISCSTSSIKRYAYSAQQLREITQELSKEHQYQ